MAKRKAKFSRQEYAGLIRSGSIEVTCGNCGTKMQPDKDDWVSCPKCQKELGEWDKFDFKKSVIIGRKH
ncbi:hypothetical protein [Bradyrhizobium ottawaense]|uniref:Uncharacterized protein n=1 Tax=Bradyrhizobium ottawaense TaxID=931866 RepID=A0ABY0QH05_9BRAD|nr:hypothetical protein [Bradyrhizobium ottawaense]SDK38710.1 hypothetical protein SAMN05444163_7991 [Bradyrhizobium ottawaense]SDK46722.1 hypothetical protein SAMN05444163_8184 [Bradyrhizobium ottawaense]